MREIWIITRKELASFFDSLVAYILLLVFLVLTGIFTWLGGSDIFLYKQASLQVFFQVAWWTLLIFIPAITMKTIAEERRAGTMELLLTKSITDRQVVSGKFLACLLLVVIALALTLPYYITVANLGNIDHGATISGYLGLVFMSACYIAFGIFASSITNNQIVAFLSALFICILFHFLFSFLGSNLSGWLAELFSALSMSTHFESISRGVIDSKDIIYFFSLIILGLFLAEFMVSKRK